VPALGLSLVVQRLLELERRVGREGAAAHEARVAELEAQLAGAGGAKAGASGVCATAATAAAGEGAAPVEAAA
jgi:hypothetical protein